MSKPKHTKNSKPNDYSVIMERVALNIRRIRYEKELTQEDMHSLGFERRWYQRIESGTYSISLPTLNLLANAFKVDISEFFKKIN